jgi:hypothetical protein
MTRTQAFRYVGGAVAAVALLLPAQAFASFSPKTSVSSTEAGTTTIVYQQGTADDVLSRVSFFVPDSVFANTGQPQGTAVGTATVKTDAGTFTGPITAMLATDTVTVGGVATALSGLGVACSGLPATGAAPPAYWVINATSAGQTLQLPIYVYPIFASDPVVGDHFIQRMVICPPAPSVKLQSLTLAVTDALSVSPGFDVWHALAVPFAAGTANPNAGAAVENEAQDRTPHLVTLHAKRGKVKGTVAVSGKVSEGGRAVTGAAVKLLAGTKVVGSAKTRAGGTFTAVLKTPAKTLVASATVATRGLPSCVEPLFGPAPCLSSTVGGFTTTSDPAPVR